MSGMLVLMALICVQGDYFDIKLPDQVFTIKTAPAALNSIYTIKWQPRGWEGSRITPGANNRGGKKNQSHVQQLGEWERENEVDGIARSSELL